jgi:hypothetical protein
MRGSILIFISQSAPGHWEGDLLSGPNNSYIATFVERHTRYVMLAKVAGKGTQTVVTVQVPDLGPGKGTYGSSSLYVGDQNRRIFLRSAKPVAARVEREHQWPA